MQKGEVGPHGLPVTYHAISSEPPTPSLLPNYTGAVRTYCTLQTVLSLNTQSTGNPSPPNPSSTPATNLTQSTSSLHYTPNQMHIQTDISYTDACELPADRTSARQSDRT